MDITVRILHQQRYSTPATKKNKKKKKGGGERSSSSNHKDPIPAVSACLLYLAPIHDCSLLGGFREKPSPPLPFLRIQKEKRGMGRGVTSTYNSRSRLHSISPTLRQVPHPAPPRNQPRAVRCPSTRTESADAEGFFRWRSRVWNRRFGLRGVGWDGMAWDGMRHEEGQHGLLTVYVHIVYKGRQQWNATATIPLAPSPNPNPILYNFPFHSRSHPLTSKSENHSIPYPPPYTPHSLPRYEKELLDPSSTQAYKLIIVESSEELLSTYRAPILSLLPLSKDIQGEGVCFPLVITLASRPPRLQPCAVPHSLRGLLCFSGNVPFDSVAAGFLDLLVVSFGGRPCTGPLKRR